MIWAPCMIACAILPAAILPSGTSTSGLSPAFAAYAAIEADVLPVEAQTTACGALVDGDRDRRGHAAVLERAGRVVALDLELHLAAGDPGEPARSATSGVPPSPRRDRRGARGEVEQVAVLLDHAPPLVGPCGSRRARAVIRLLRVALDPHHRGDLADDVHARAGARRSPTSCGVGRAVGDDDELGVVAAALLPDRLDRDAVLGERGRDRGQHAGAVVDVDRRRGSGSGSRPSAAPRGRRTPTRRGRGCRRAGCGRR